MIKPLGNRVLIQPSEVSDKHGSLYIPETAKDKPTWGTAIAVGVACDEICVNDKVIFSKYGGTDYEHEGVTYVLIREEDVLGVIQ